MSTASSKSKAKHRLLEAGAILFAKQGFEGTPIREICAHAGTGINMVHHYFGSKQGLFDALIASVSEEIFETPVRAIKVLPSTRGEFIARFEMFAEETLRSMIEHRLVFIMAMREEVIPHSASFNDYNTTFIKFLKHGKKLGFLSESVEPAMLTGLMIDRLGNQVQHSEWIRKTAGVDISNEAYRKRWLAANLQILLFGMLSAEEA